MCEYAESVTQLIQVTYASDKNEIDEREVAAFEVATSELKCENVLVITWDYEWTISIGNRLVNYVPLWKWLLESAEKHKDLKIMHAK